jgi:hypothetical protein
MVRKVLLGVVVALAALATFVASRPDDYRVQRSARIAAPVGVVYAHVVSLHRWEAWSPWAKLDPRMSVEYGGPEAGPGATYAWKGNRDVGEGRMTVLDAKPDAQVVLHLEFLAPMKDEATTTFDLAPAGGATEVTWSMSGKLGFIGKAMCMVSSMDRMVGPDFEKGLARLEAVAEEEAQHANAASP